VRWLGLLGRSELAQVYAAADLLVFPSHADTFGLVMVEAMATGTPVAAYPVDGPLEVLGRRAANGRSLGGAMHDDLQQACFAALAVPRHEARARALDFSWAYATELFVSHLVSARPLDERSSPQARLSVTRLSSGPPTLS
jgi:glycosyltransferase involved in cell wall biosynthesis